MSSRFYKILVLSFIALTASCSAFKSGYNESELRARENVLKDDLLQMRKMIDQYSADQGELPQSLDDLVSAQYLKVIPNDPFTGKPDWEVVQEDYTQSVDQQDTGITDVKSSSAQTSSDGSAYNTW